MNLFKRELAPILPDVWRLIDEEARRALGALLAGRRVVDFAGPRGWAHGAVDTGQVLRLSPSPVNEVRAALRLVQPLVELHSAFHLDVVELDSVARGGAHPDLSAVVGACARVARAEDDAVFNGYAAAGIEGVLPASPHAPVLVSDAVDLPRAVAHALERLRSAGVGGPYALALGTVLFEAVTAATEEGYPIANRIERLLADGRLVHAPAIAGGVLISMRGGDYELTVGQDLSIGYTACHMGHVELYLLESFTFRVLEPAAAVALRSGEKRDV